MAGVLTMGGVLSGSVVSTRSLTGTMISSGILVGTISAPTTIPFPEYEGTYVVTPKTTSQVLNTTLKSMYEDVEVVSIPYFEVSNMQGGSTIIIGGND